MWLRALLLVAIFWLSNLSLQTSLAQPAEAPANAPATEIQLREISARLMARIDEIITQSSVGPAAPTCSDEDYLRRAYLDLWGTIPTATQAKEFLQDDQPHKRERLVDTLLDAPQFAQHMAYTVDVWLMERRSDRGISRADWQEYLYQSFLDRKPFDQLAREVIAADGSDGQQRARAKLFLDRDCNHQTLVRDVSRIFLGRDLQCAQCHDHPLVDDYYQREYHGLLALLQRSYVFTDKEKENRTYVGERGNGVPEYRSVFIEDDTSKVAVAYVAGKSLIEVPLDNVGDEYVVAPAEKARGVPKFSLRAELASNTTIENALFDKSITNRFWRHMFGRGLVEPVDMHHGDNPPTHPELLQELATTWRELGYDVRELLAAMAKSEAYQRSIDPPSLQSITAARDQTEQVACEVSTEVDQLQAALTLREADLDVATTARREHEAALQAQLRVVVDLRAKLVTGLAEKEKTGGELDKTNKQLSEARANQAVVGEAAEKAKAALEKLADDPQVKSASDALSAKKTALEKSVGELTTQAEELQAKFELLEKECQQHRPALAEAQQELNETYQPFRDADQNWFHSLQQRDAEKAALALAERRLRQAERLLQLTELVEAGNESSEDANRAFDELQSDWSALHAVANPRPLSPEQLAWSSWQATGHLQIEEQTAQQEWLEKNPIPTNLDPTSKAQHEEQSIHQIRQGVLGRMANAIDQFSKLFGGGAGQVQTDFFATADQALFLANSDTIQNILAPQNDNLSARLHQLDKADAIAGELYLSVLSRPPSPEEQQVVATYLEQRNDQREAAVRELAWSLLTSAEFRFYR